MNRSMVVVTASVAGFGGAFGGLFSLLFDVYAFWPSALALVVGGLLGIASLVVLYRF